MLLKREMGGGGLLPYPMMTGGSMRQTQPQSGPPAGPQPGVHDAGGSQAARLVASILGLGDVNLHFRMSGGGTVAHRVSDPTPCRMSIRSMPMCRRARRFLDRFSSPSPSTSFSFFLFSPPTHLNGTGGSGISPSSWKIIG